MQLPTPTPKSAIDTTQLSVTTPKYAVDSTLLSTPTPKSAVDKTQLSTPTLKSASDTTQLSTPTPKSAVHTMLLYTLYSSMDILLPEVTESTLSTIGHRNVSPDAVLYLKASSTPPLVGTVMKMTRSPPAPDALRSLTASTTTSSEMTRSPGGNVSAILLSGNNKTKLHAR